MSRRRRYRPTPVATALARLLEARAQYLATLAEVDRLYDAYDASDREDEALRRAASELGDGPLSAAHKAEHAAEQELLAALRSAGLRAAAVGGTLAVDPEGQVNLDAVGDPWDQCPVILIPMARVSIGGRR